MNPVDALMTGDVSTFKAQVNDMLMHKLSDALDQKRLDVAKTLFTKQEEPAEVSDQDEVE